MDDATRPEGAEADDRDAILARARAVTHRGEGDLVVHDTPTWLRPLLAFQRTTDRVNEAVGSISKYLAILVVFVGFFNAVLRYIGRFTGNQLTSNRYIELQWYLYAAIFLLAFGYILKHGVNVRVDFWFADQPRRTKAWIDAVGHVIGLLPFCALGLWVIWTPMLKSFGRSPDGSWRTWRVWEIWELSPDPGGLPRAPIKGLLFVGFVLLTAQAVAEMIKLVAELTGHGHTVETTSTVAAPARVE